MYDDLKFDNHHKLGSIGLDPIPLERRTAELE